MADWSELRRRHPSHQIPDRDHNGFEIARSSRASRLRMDALDQTQIPTSWLHPALHATRSSLRAARRSSLAPDVSYDVDGDGAVSSEDYRAARRWDKQLVGHLSAHERASAHAEQCSKLRGALTEAEVGENKRARRILDRLGEPPHPNETWRHYNLREANMVINSLKHKSSTQVSKRHLPAMRI